MKLNIKPTVFTVCTKLSYNPDFVNKKIATEGGAPADPIRRGADTEGGEAGC
jgi:hypothetical protein